MTLYFCKHNDFIVLTFRREIIKQDRALLRFLSPVSHNHTWAAHYLACITFPIDLAYQQKREPSQPRTSLLASYQINLSSGRLLHLQSPAHWPSSFPSGTLINGILCSEHNATTSFLYASSSQASFSTHIWACRRSSALLASRSPRASPSCISAILRTPFNASRTDIWPLPAEASPLISTSPPPVSPPSLASPVSLGELGSSPSDYNLQNK